MRSEPLRGNGAGSFCPSPSGAQDRHSFYICAHGVHAHTDCCVTVTRGDSSPFGDVCTFSVGDPDTRGSDCVIAIMISINETYLANLGCALSAQDFFLSPRQPRCTPKEVTPGPIYIYATGESVMLNKF